MTGPRGAHLTLRSRIRKGRNTVVAQLSILGSRKVPWRLRLYAGRSIIAEDALLTR